MTAADDAREALEAAVHEELTLAWTRSLSIPRGSVPAADPQQAGAVKRIMRAAGIYGIASRADELERAEAARRLGAVTAEYYGDRS